jgi:regulator of sigma E protease
MSYVLAFLGFAVLILLHEGGHFAAAKAVGMRVERFSLFFGPLVLKRRIGETVYGIGVIPLGGYVKITGMNPNEQIAAEYLPRAYYNQPVWKRVVTILAGPAVNILIAFFIVLGLLLAQGQAVANTRVAGIESNTPAAGVLRVGDQIVSADGIGGSESAIRRQIESHHCAGTPTNGCVAAAPVRLVLRRAGRLITVMARPRYKAQDGHTEVGFEFGYRFAPIALPSAASGSVSYLWSIATQTVSTVARIFEPQERRQLNSVVGGYTITQESFATSTTLALRVLALISLSLGVINLFPFLPLDGGHVFWAVAERVRGRRIPFYIMERAGVVGFVLILLVFAIGLSNDISTLAGPGFNLR